jgi:LacI family transcriptional regulator
VTYLTERGIPFVTHGRTSSNPTHAFVDGDGEAGFDEATRLLAASGHRRIAFIGGPDTYTFAALRRAGWEKACLDLGLDTRACSIETELNDQGGYIATSTLLKRGMRPTALLCATDAIALGAYAAVRDHGIEPGRDIAIVGHDNLPTGRYMTPPLSTMEIVSDHVADRLAEMLLARIGGTDPAELQTVFPVRQIWRASHIVTGDVTTRDVGSRALTSKCLPASVEQKEEGL